MAAETDRLISNARKSWRMAIFGCYRPEGNHIAAYVGRPTFFACLGLPEMSDICHFLKGERSRIENCVNSFKSGKVSETVQDYCLFKNCPIFL